MTVYADGKPFSSVRAVTQDKVFSLGDSSWHSMDYSMEGQAIVIDTKGRTFYALLTRPDESEYSRKVANYALLPMVPEFKRNPMTDTYAVEKGTESLDRMATRQRNMVKIKGPVELPRTRPNPDLYRGPRELDAWPIFVTFDKPDDPMSVREVSPESIGISRITIEITKDDVTTGILDRLKWGNSYRRRHFDGSNSIAQDMRNPDFRSRMSIYDFTTQSAK